MTARNEFRFRKQTKAAIIVQVLLSHLKKYIILEYRKGDITSAI